MEKDFDGEITNEYSLRDRLSNGHLGFSSDWEFFDIKGQVYVAERDTAIAPPSKLTSDEDINGLEFVQGTRDGRWICSRHDFERLRFLFIPGGL